MNSKYFSYSIAFLRKHYSNDVVDCVKGDDNKNPEHVTCEIPGLSGLTDSMIQNQIETGYPLIFLDVNKIIGWEPKNRKTVPPSQANNTFEIDTVYFECFEYDRKTGEPKAESNFKFEIVEGGLQGVSANYFPYLGKDKAVDG